MNKPMILGIAFLFVATVAALIGFYLGTKRATYRQCRWDISTATSSNAKLDSKFYDRIYRDNDTILLGNYYGIQTLPKWLLPMFTLGEERSSEKRIKIIADGIEESLRRSGISEPRSNIEQVARDWLAFHTVGPPVHFKRGTGIEQGGADQPATAPESKSAGDSKPQPESEGRSQ